jgi:hypothetical protein
VSPLWVVHEESGVVRLETACGVVLGRAVPLRGGSWRWQPEDVTVVDLRPVHPTFGAALACCRRVTRAQLARALRGLPPPPPRRPSPRPAYDPARHAAHRPRPGGRPPHAVVDREGRRFASLAEAAAAYGVRYLLVQAWCMRGEGGWRRA